MFCRLNKYTKGEFILLGTYLDNVRKASPLIHNITNYVTVNDVANALLACGASPIMADDHYDAEEITAICSGLCINIGTLNTSTIASMFLAGTKAQALGHTLLLDPVGAGASTIRTRTALGLTQSLKFDVIRGNASEIKTLVLGAGTTHGVDADKADSVSEENLAFMVKFVKDFAHSSGAIIALTGKIDLVADSGRCFVIRNGRPEMGRITGTGCMLSGIMTAFVAANSNHKLEAAAAAVCTMGLAGEIGYTHLQAHEGNATYRNRIIDALYCMTGEILDGGAKYEVL